jgi:hypothetical protein
MGEPTPPPLFIPNAPPPHRTPKWMSRLWDERQFLLGAVGTFITLGALAVSIWQTNMTRKALLVGQKQFALTQRSFLTLSHEKLVWLMLSKSGTITYQIDVVATNKGHSPAEKVLPIADVRVGQPNSSYSPVEELNEVCHSWDKPGIGSGMLVPIDDQLTLHHQHWLSGNAVRQLIRSTMPNLQGTRTISLRVPVCVRYMDKLTTDVHHEAEEFDLTLNIDENQFNAIDLQGVLLFGPHSDPTAFHKSEIINGLSD